MKRLKASFTIEAAVIVPLTIFIIAAFMYMAFYIHDRAVMGSAGAAYIIENAADYSDSLSTIEEDTREMLENRLIIAENISVSVTDDDGITLESSADINMPLAFLSSILGTSPDSVSTSVNISMLDGRAQVLKYKAAADGIDVLAQSE